MLTRFEVLQTVNYLFYVLLSVGSNSILDILINSCYEVSYK